jgi:hypothetical protein
MHMSPVLSGARLKVKMDLEIALVSLKSAVSLESGLTEKFAVVLIV